MRFILRIQGWFNIQKSIYIIHHINKLRREKPDDISIDAGKAFDKIQHSFLIKTLSRLTIKITSSIWYRAPVKNLKLTSCLMVKDWMFYPSDWIQQHCIIFGLSCCPFWIIVLIGSFVLPLWETVAVFKKLNKFCHGRTSQSF